MNKQFRTFSLLVLFVVALISCEKKTTTQPESNQTTKTSEWIQLLDDTHAEGWRAYNGESLPPGWVIENNVLSFDTELGLEQNYKGGIDIIYGAEEFDNFELYVEWKIPKGGNSGIFYHLKEQIDGMDAPDISPEYQLIDDENYADIHDLTAYNTSIGFENPSQLHPLQQTASDYAMHAADASKKKLNPVGEWNTTKIIFTPEKVEHWLNGEIVVSFVPWTEQWNAKKNAGKWKDANLYGSFKSGFIGFQDHSSPIWFRNVKIKKL
ncbi:DUF1080 domain-containing protein [Urechidicola sp. KH5]